LGSEQIFVDGWLVEVRGLDIVLFICHVGDGCGALMLGWLILIILIDLILIQLIKGLAVDNLIN